MVRPKVVILDLNVPGASGLEAVQVVDDNASVRKLMVKTLQASGYQVLAAAEGRTALRTFAKPKGPIDLLITDVIMPIMIWIRPGEPLKAIPSEVDGFSYLFTRITPKT